MKNYIGCKIDGNKFHKSIDEIEKKQNKKKNYLEQMIS